MLFVSSALLALILSLAMAHHKPVSCQNDLSVYVYHLAAEPVTYQNSTNLSFSPTAFTLIAGKHEAILVDAPATRAQGKEVAAWVDSVIPGKTLKSIYVTHGHGDHFFSVREFQSTWPDVKALATEDTAAHIAQQYEEPFHTLVWDSLFPGKLDQIPIEVETLDASGDFFLEGHLLKAVEVGQADTYNSTVLHVPDLGLVVGGDVVYGNCHQLFAEDITTELRNQWILSLEKVAKLNPSIVVPSHTLPDDGYSPDHIGNTTGYIQTYESLLSKSDTWQELENSLKATFPQRDGTFILRWTSQAPFNASF